MAALESIRKRGPIVAAIIGLALLAFILGDLVRSGDFLIKNERYQIAKIYGKSIPYQDYQKKVDELENFYKLRGANVNEEQRDQMRSQVWELLVRENVLNDEMENLGVGVSSDELFDMVQGRSIDPVVRQLFTNQQTGQFNPADVVNFLKTMDQNDPSGNAKTIWLYMENNIKQGRAFTKYLNLISKGLNITNQQVKSEFNERNYTVDFNYVFKKYSSIPDKDVKITESDLKDYYDNHINEFKQEESRGIEYVTFDVLPSSDDRQAAQDFINKIKNEFQTTTEIKQFISLNSDVPFDEKHYKKGEFTNPIIDSTFFKASPGTIYGPYVDENSFKLARLVEVKEIADTVKARHILIQPDGKKIVDMKRAKEIADSLKEIIVKKKADFETLVNVYSADEGSKVKKGDLGWFKEADMVKPFSEACFNGKKGDLTVVESQFGVHIIEILDIGKKVKKIQVGIAERKIEPSSRTFQILYSEASKFAGANNTREKFEKSIEKMNLTKKVAPNLNSNEKVIAGLDNPREMVRWAFKAEKDQVSTVFEFGSKYVVAVLTDIRKKGIAPFDQVKDQIEYYVKQEKKGEILSEKLKKYVSESSMDAIAQKMDTTVLEAKNINFTSFSLPNAGFEPEVIAYAVQLPKDKISDPIIGKAGVYIIKVTIVTPPPQNKNLDLQYEKKKMLDGIQSRATYSAYEALKEIANIADERSKFY